MQKYVIVTESGADLPQSIKERDDVYALDMYVTMDGVDYPDGSISIEELCSYFDKTGKVPTTSAVNPEEYLAAFQEINDKYPDAVILHISYSSVVSCTYQNAVIAAEGFTNIHHIDTLNVSAGQGIIVMKALELIGKKPDIGPEELVAAIHKFSDLSKFIFIPGNLTYLRAGGRVSNAQFLGASILKIKPLIEIIKGKLISTKKYRGSLSNIAGQVIRDYFDRFNIDKSEINMIHTNRIDKDLLTELNSLVKNLGAEKINWLTTGCVITSHAGPGGFGIAALEKS